MFRFYNFLVERIGAWWLERREEARDEYDRLGREMQGWRSLLERLKSPYLKLRAALPHHPPVSADVNAMWDEAARDLYFLRQAGKSVLEQMERDLELLAGENAALDALLAAELRAAEASAMAAKRLAGMQVISERFLNPLAFEGWAGQPRLEFAFGAVTLPQVRRGRLAESEVTIVPGKVFDGILGDFSNGFPGNFHELVGGRFAGYDDARANPGAVLDGSFDTWFEYEAVSILPSHRPTYGRNWALPGGGRLVWDREPEGGELRLCLQFRFEPSLINGLRLRYYIPKGSSPPVLREITLVGEDGRLVALSGEWRREGVDTFDIYFVPVVARGAYLHFAQPRRYPARIGVITYTALADASDYYLRGAGRKLPGYRIEGHVPSASFLGVEKKGMVLSYPWSRPGFGSPGVREVMEQGLAAVARPDVEQGVDDLPGYRYCIGLREVELAAVEFGEYGELVCGPYAVEDAGAVTIVPFVNLPPVEGTWARCWVSADRLHWAEVTPLSEGGRPVYFVSGTEEGVEGNVVRVLSRPRELWVRVAMGRPANRPEVSPCLTGWDLLVAPEGAVILT